MIIDFDEKTVSTTVDGQRVTLSFEEAKAQGVITQEELDKREKQMVRVALIEIEDAGYEDLTEEANKQNGSNHWYVFSNSKGVHYCDTIDDLFDLAETL